MEVNSKIKNLTYISVGVAALIVGGFAIFHLSLVFPIPGVKYILMSPYLSMVIFILLSKVKGKNTLLKMGTIFGLIMMIINIYMGVTIIMTAGVTQVSISKLEESKKAFYGAILFSGFTGLFSLLVAKVIIGGLYMEIPNYWIVIAGILCLVSGLIGTLFAKKLIKYISGSHRNKTYGQ